MGDTAAARLADTRRFREILRILRRHRLTQGLTPAKVRLIFNDLGPTFVKFGQILSMRSDILPKEYCTALEELRTDAEPMPASQVYEILSGQYGCDWHSVFSDIEPIPLGSASIAQAHEAYLAEDGRRVVIKVQRPDLYKTMQRDLRLLKRVASLMKYTPIGSALDFRKVIDEMWKTVQQELDFTVEAQNLAEFRQNNQDIVYVGCPEVFDKLCTRCVLVMEHIGGHQIDDTQGLLDDGYDLEEISNKLVHNFIKQITVDRFFHADPHPGNIRVQGGKIIWLDLGMMGRLTKREADLYLGLINTLNDNDSMALTDVLLSLGKYDHLPDKVALSAVIDGIIAKYKSMPMSEMDLGAIVEELVGVLNEYGISVPSSLTMLGRSLLVFQGMLTSVSPQFNLVEIVADYVKSSISTSDFVSKKVKNVLRQAVMSGDKLTMLPAQASDFLRKVSTGQMVINVKKTSSAAENENRYILANRLILGALLCVLLLASAVCCLSDIAPKLLGLPWPAAAFFACALVTGAVLLSRGKKKK